MNLNYYYDFADVLVTSYRLLQIILALGKASGDKNQRIKLSGEKT